MAVPCASCEFSKKCSVLHKCAAKSYKEKQFTEVHAFYPLWLMWAC